MLCPDCYGSGEDPRDIPPYPCACETCNGAGDVPGGWADDDVKCKCSKCTSPSEYEGYCLRCFDNPDCD